MTVWQNKFIRPNKYSRPQTKIKGVRKIVMHWTANMGAGADNHYRYFNNLQGRYASAHIFVDKNEALCIIPLNEVAYHANDGSRRNISELRPNANLLSLGVELCVEKDGSFHPNTISRTEDVVAELCRRYNLNPLKDIVRHYDITVKNCPAPWVKNSQAFVNFKNAVNRKLNGKSITVTSPYEGESIVDYLSRIGTDSSFSSRSKLAQQYGIANYKGTAAQNLELLDKVKSQIVKASVEEKGDELTMSQYNELKKLIDQKLDKPSNYDSKEPTWGNELWNEIANQEKYFNDGRPHNYVSRIEGAALIQRLTDNIEKFKVDPLKKEIEELKQMIEGLKSSKCNCGCHNCDCECHQCEKCDCKNK